MASRSLLFVLLATVALSSLLSVALANDGPDQCYDCGSGNRCEKQSDKDNKKCWSKDYCYYNCNDKEDGMQCDPKYAPKWCDKSKDNHSCQDRKNCFYNCPNDKPHCKAGWCYDPSENDRMCESKNYCFYKN